MKISKILFHSVVINLCCFSVASAQSDTVDYFKKDYLRYENRIYVDNIRSVKFEQNGVDLSDPILELKGESQLRLSFDDFNDQVAQYSYTIEHCDASWSPSNVMETQYIEGFNIDQISDYDFSFNTLTPYTHFYLLFPNNRMSPKISGNYILKVFKDFNAEEVVLTRRFMVVDRRLGINFNIKRATVINERNSRQEIDFEIQYPGYPILNPFGDIEVCILQNGRWDNAICGLKPLFVRDDKLIYDYEEGNVFDGGNEFRYLDIRTVRYKTETVAEMQADDKNYFISLLVDRSRAAMRYSIMDDINGRFLIKQREGNNSALQAEYVNVKFQLRQEAPLNQGSVYVFGELTDWRLIKNARMNYNYDKKLYETTLLLKQGYYNYQYVFVGDGPLDIDETYFEGNHFETENEYVILVYHQQVGNRFMELVGMEQFNSSNIY